MKFVGHVIHFNPSIAIFGEVINHVSTIFGERRTEHVIIKYFVIIFGWCIDGSGNTVATTLSQSNVDWSHNFYNYPTANNSQKQPTHSSSWLLSLPALPSIYVVWKDSQSTWRQVEPNRNTRVSIVVLVCIVVEIVECSGWTRLRWVSYMYIRIEGNCVTYVF